MKYHTPLLRTIEQSSAAVAKSSCQALQATFSRESCELHLGLCKDISKFSHEIVCWRHVDIHLFVEDISNTLCYVVRKIDCWNDS